MNITFLGTGTSLGVPIIGCKCRTCVSVNPKDKRLRSSVLIEVDGKNFVIDTGPDFRQQMLREKVERVDAVLYTHEHRDHVAGLDDLRSFNFIMEKKMEIYATESVQQSLHSQFEYVFTEKKYPGIPEVNFHTIENKPFTIDGVTFTPILVKHLHLPVFGFRVGNFTYITDANFIPEEEKQKILGSEVLVLNALRHEEHPSHFTFSEAMALAKELNCKTTYFTHISHLLGLHEEVNEGLPDNIRLAYDGLHIHLKH